MMHLHKDKNIYQEIVHVTADEMGIPEEYVDKDYFVSLLLKKIIKESPNIIFKGGTSLSKCYGVINRFSEDIDITLSLTSNASNRDKRDLKNAINSAIEKADMKLYNPKEIYTRRNFNKYEVEYDTTIGTGEILKPHLLIETYLFIKSFPFERKRVNNYILKYLKKEGYLDLIKQYELDSFYINVQSIERTFIDKVFIICDYHESGSYTQNSRHLYDLHKIWENSTFNYDELAELFYEVAVVRRKSNHINRSSVRDYPLRNTLRNILENDFYKDDYNSNTLYLLYDQVDYQVVKNTLFQILESGILPNVIK